MKETYIHPDLKSKYPKPDKSIYISYTQFSTFSKCRRRWKLKYIDRIKDDKPSIHTVFGNAMHVVIQNYFETMFLQTVKAADQIDFSVVLLDQMKHFYQEEVKKYNSTFSSKEELSDFYLSGLECLNFLRKKRKNYVDKKNWELLGIEIPILLPPIESKPGVALMGFIDVAFRDKRTGRIIFYDLKTSGKGWSKWDKIDRSKTDQLILYKKYFSVQYGLDINNIDVEFLILRRKIDTDNPFPPKRIQMFKPTQGTVALNRTIREFEQFINHSFVEPGQYNTDAIYPAICGTNSFNCKFCEFNNENLCPTNQRMTQLNLV